MKESLPLPLALSALFVVQALLVYAGSPLECSSDDAKYWLNPSIVVGPDSISVAYSTSEYATRADTNAEQLPNLLKRLPPQVWPCGDNIIGASSTEAAGSPGEKVRTHKNVNAVKQVLKDNGINVEWWASPK
jgi:hypothetical protein